MTEKRAQGSGKTPGAKEGAAAPRGTTKKRAPAAASKGVTRSRAAKSGESRPAARAGEEPGGERFDPRVLVFACNWCSYAGADTAGVSRLQHEPNFRLLRVMCSGRVHPSHVLRAFAQGADGVMVSGCHPGDCHYMFGNYRAMEQYEKTSALAALLGLEPERLRLEWISAAEGIRFAETMNEFIEAVRGVGRSPLAPGNDAGGDARNEPAPSGTPPLEATRVFACLECGRCTAVCPVARYQRFSPRRLITRTFAAGAAGPANDPALWTCLTCSACEAVCPVRVDYGQFIVSARAQAVARRSGATDGDPAPAAPEGQPGDGRQPSGSTAASGWGGETQQVGYEVTPCSHGGVFEQISRMAARPGLRQQRLGWLSEDLEVEVLADGQRGKSDDLLYVGCSPYFSAYFGGETGAGLTRTMSSAVQLLNHVGIRPALLANERCCGYHLRLAGYAREADELEALVVDQVRASGATRVITFCPECLVALRDALDRHNVACEVTHLSLVLGALREELAEMATDSADGRVTYQDPCRLGRHSGIYDRPRQLLTEVAGVELVEMEHHRERAVCCGNTAWLNCNAATKRFQADRLAEAVATGGRRLVTACPGCFIHLRCAQEGLTEDPAADLEIVDLWNLLADALPPTAAGVAAAAGQSVGDQGTKV
ncbi:MAG: hydrogenase iron-sulfur subunit [Candidatus Eisenbacteria sp.]|nr:hydrogenase iron-sulfur subunit [Candidatus Eisenbacteria bacterium]